MARLLSPRPRWAGGVLCLLLTAGCGRHLAAGGTEAGPSTPPSPTPAGASAPAAASSPGEAPTVPPPAAEVAAQFVTALSTHDARPGHDRALHDANARTRPYVTDRVYAQIADPQTRTSAALWQQLSAAAAVSDVQVDKVAVPEGAPAPTAQQAEVRVTYTVTTSGRNLQDTQTLSQAMQVSATPAGWRVDQLLAF